MTASIGCGGWRAYSRPRRGVTQTQEANMIDITTIPLNKLLACECNWRARRFLAYGLIHARRIHYLVPEAFHSITAAGALALERHGELPRRMGL